MFDAAEILFSAEIISDSTTMRIDVYSDLFVNLTVMLSEYPYTTVRGTKYDNLESCAVYVEDEIKYAKSIFLSSESTYFYDNYIVTAVNLPRTAVFTNSIKYTGDHAAFIILNFFNGEL